MNQERTRPAGCSMSDSSFALPPPPAGPSFPRRNAGYVNVHVWGKKVEMEQICRHKAIPYPLLQGYQEKEGFHIPTAQGQYTIPACPHA